MVERAAAIAADAVQERRAAVGGERVAAARRSQPPHHPPGDREEGRGTLRVWEHQEVHVIEDLRAAIHRAAAAGQPQPPVVRVHIEGSEAEPAR